MSASETLTTASEVPEPVPKPTKAKRQSSTVASDPNRFQHGVLVRGKFIGVEDVKEENGDDLCQTSMIKLKAVVLAKKEHKQPICIKINLEGIEILDEKTNQPMFKHLINRISYIARDPTDSRAIGYIYKNSPNNFQYYAIKTKSQAQELFNTLKDLFEVVLEINKANKKKVEVEDKSEEENKSEDVKTEAKNEKPTLTTLKSTDSNDQLISGLEEKIKQMNDQPALIDLPTQEQSKFEDSYQSSFEKSLDLLQIPTTKNNASELSDLFNNSTSTTSAPQNEQAKPQTQGDRYSMLVNELSGLSINQQRPAPVPPMALNQAQLASPNPFFAGPQVMTQQTMQQSMQHQQFYGQQLTVPSQNPFGAFAPNPGMQVNQMQGNNFQASRPAGPTGGVYLQQVGGMPGVQPNAFVNQSQQKPANQFPW